MRVAVMAVTVGVAMALASACGGSSGPSSAEKTQSAQATATVEAVHTEANALTALVLQPSDVPAGLPDIQTFGNESGEVISYTTTYGDDAFSIVSTIGRAEPGKTIDQTVLRFRQLQKAVFRIEHNYAIDGADQAFSYSHPQAMGAATLILKDGYYADVVVQTTDTARQAEAQDQANLDRYTKITFDRLKAYLADPTSVTPIPDAPRYSYDPTPSSTGAPTPPTTAD